VVSSLDVLETVFQGDHLPGLSLSPLSNDDFGNFLVRVLGRHLQLGFSGKLFKLLLGIIGVIFGDQSQCLV